LHSTLAGAVDPGAGEERDWEAEARAQGWKPLPADPANVQPNEFRGEPAKWCDARTYVMRGEEALPVLRETVRRLTDRNARQERKIEQLETVNQESLKKIDDLIDLAKTAQARGYRQAREELEQKRIEAITNGDVATVTKIELGLKQIDIDAAALDKVGKPIDLPTPAAPTAPKPAAPDPEIEAFAEANKAWWNKDNFLTQQMIAEHLVVMRESPAMPLGDQLAKALTTLKGKFPREFGITPRPTAAPAATEDEVDDEPPRRAAPVAAPRHEPEGGVRHRSPWERIPEAERAEAKKEFARMQGFDEGLTAEEYVETYVNPSADIVSLQKKFRKKQ
jgi:hypothetical protein